MSYQTKYVHYTGEHSKNLARIVQNSMITALAAQHVVLGISVHADTKVHTKNTSAILGLLVE